MTENIYFESSILFLKSGKTVSLRYDIAEILIFQEVIIARLDIPHKVVFNENVYGISHDGRLLWQVPKLDHVYQDSPYTGMKILNDDLILCNWDGLDVTIDPISGTVLKSSYGK